MKRFPWRNALIQQVSRTLLGITERLGRGPDLNHGLDHHLAVEGLALLIKRKQRLRADVEVVRAAALVHDVGYALGPGREHIVTGMAYAQEVLPKVGFPAQKISAVLQVIKHHDDRKPEGTGGTPNIAEVLLVKDADTLTVMGAMGLTRLAYFTAYLNGPIVPFEALLDGQALDGWGLGTSLTAHLFGWYQKLPTHLHLEASKEIARQRLLFQRAFEKQLKRELRELYGGKATKIRRIHVG
jgi:putative nucleotidyltransferase with HDIG domain